MKIKRSKWLIFVKNNPAGYGIRLENNLWDYLCRLKSQLAKADLRFTMDLSFATSVASFINISKGIS